VVERRAGQLKRGNSERDLSRRGHSGPVWGVREQEEVSNALSWETGRCSTVSWVQGFLKSRWKNSSAAGQINDGIIHNRDWGEILSIHW